MTAHPSPIRITWPPPGLEGTQGILWKKARAIGLGGALIVLPSLPGLLTQQAFNSFGLFGTAWWIQSLSALLGLLVLTGAFGGLVAFFIRARDASSQGIDMETILQVASDTSGDMGALIQGTRSFRSLSENRRAQAIQARVSAAILFLSGAIWIPVGWVLSLSLAGRGLLGPAGLALVTLAPAAVIFLMGLVCKGVEGTILQEVFGPLFWRRRQNPGQEDAARLWGEGIQELRTNRGERTTPGSGISLAGALSAASLGFLIFFPVVGFTLATSVGPVVASMAVPRFSATERRAGEVEALRHLRLPTEPGLSPMEAGEALHSIASVGGRSRSSELLKNPVRRFENAFIASGSENPTGMQPGLWPIELFLAISEGADPERDSYLREVAGHPALAEFDHLARAQAIDVLGARMVLPLPQQMSALQIPIPRFSSLRQGGYAMVAKAAVEFMDGDVNKAEATLLTSLSAGFLLLEEAPTLIDALIATVLVTISGDALEGLYRAAGRDGEAETLHRLRETTRRATEAVQGVSFGPSPREALAGMSKRVTARETLRGLRWEYFHILAGLSPCLNPRQIVFGPDQSYADFLESVRSDLVRYPGEEAVFRVMQKGWYTQPARGGLERALVGTVRAVLGNGPAGCAEVLGAGIF